MNIPPPPPGFQVNQPPVPPSAGGALRPLSAEDSDNGYWDARRMGNGQGRSFIVRNGVQTFVTDAELQQIIGGGGSGAPAGNGVPPPPPGFELNQPVQGANASVYEDSLARASQMSQFSGGAPARSQYNTALRDVRETQFPDMTDDQWAEYSATALAPYGLQDLAQQSQTFGFGDEIGAGISALGSGAREMVGGGGPGFDGAYDASYQLEQARLNYGRQREGGMGLAMEVLGGASTMGPARTATGALAPQVAQTGGRMMQATRAAVPLAAEGSVYGFGSTDGDFGQRAVGAGVGAGVSLLGAAVAPVAGKLIQGAARRVAQVPVNMANRAAARQAVRAAPTGAAIKATSQAAYRASEATGATITPQAMQLLAHDMQNLARMQGLMLPNGQLTSAFPKVANAIKAVRQYAQGPLTMEQAQTLLRTLRTAQKSVDPDEARLGNMMVNQFEDFLDNLPPSGFGKGNGSEAIQQWAKGRTEWARAKRTQTIEDIISDARLAPGGFAAGIRSGFAKILKAKNAKARRGFSSADLEAMEDFVAGGSMQELLERIGSGAGLPGGLMGGMAGGPLGAVAVPAAGMLARRETNRQARNTVQQLRAQVATPGGVPMRSLPPPMPLPAGLRRMGGNAANVTSSGNIRDGVMAMRSPQRLPGR